MKVLFLEASSGSVVGGSLTGMLELLRGLDRRRIEPVVVLFEDKACVAELNSADIPVRIFTKRRLPKEHGLQSAPAYEKAKSVGRLASALKWCRASVTFLLETLPAALRLARLFRELRPDVVYVCNGFRTCADAITAARLLGIPCVVHAKGFCKFSHVERILSRGVAVCVSMTRAIEEHCRAGGMQPARFEVVYDGLDLEAFRPKRDAAEVRRELGIEADAELAGLVGNVQEWKGQHVLVEALDILKERRPRFVVVLVGGVHRSGSAYAQDIRGFARERGLSGRVVWTGARGDVADLMHAMDVVVHASVRGEPFGRVIIEGMAVGRPVIATRAGGVPEFTRDGEDSILVEPGNAAELAQVLDALLSSPERREALERGALASVQRFSIGAHVESMSRLFETAARGSGAALIARSAS